MDKKSLTSLFAESIFQIPDYQRGYAWGEKQWKDFIQDIDALVDDKVRSHYTGTVVVYADSRAGAQLYGIENLKVVDVVDGQQRLTTVCLYLAVIIQALIRQGETAFESAIPKYLYAGATCRLILNNDTANVFYDLLKTGQANILPQSPHQKLITAAYKRLQEHIDGQLKERGEKGIAYLKELYHAITQQLSFTFYEIDEVSEIGMTFELMNSRGKPLTELELLKNYLMHWVSRNEGDLAQRTMLTKIINKSWKDTYTNMGRSSGTEDQCLRIAWTLYCSHTPANWKGYEGFKNDEYIPLRTFQQRSLEDTRAFIIRFAEGLADISRHYASITSPCTTDAVSKDELLWLTKIHHTGNTANFLPLMVAARIYRVGGSISEGDYIELLKALECYGYRVFLHKGRRGNAGKTSFYRWSSEIFNQTLPIDKLIGWVHVLTRYYAPEDSFLAEIAKPSIWYKARLCLKYTLFEYELHLLATEGQGKQPQLAWGHLSDATIEHILPQTPDEKSHWKDVWSSDEFKECVHDVANLVLTQDNSSYRNFEFIRKKGKLGESPSYTNSDIRQERKISSFEDWTPKEFRVRREELVAWLRDRWKTPRVQSVAPLDIAVDADEEDSEAPSKEASL